MTTFQNTLTIQRPVDDVFAFLVDFENIPTWNYAILETRKTSPGPVGVGTTYRQLRSIPDRSEEGFEVTVFEPTTRLEVRGDIGPFTATISYLLAPVGYGTQLVNVVDLESASGAVRLLAPWPPPGLRRRWRPTSTPSRRRWKRAAVASRDHRHRQSCRGRARLLDGMSAAS